MQALDSPEPSSAPSSPRTGSHAGTIATQPLAVSPSDSTVGAFESDDGSVAARASLDDQPEVADRSAAASSSSGGSAAGVAALTPAALARTSDGDDSDGSSSDDGAESESDADSEVHGGGSDSSGSVAESDPGDRVWLPELATPARPTVRRSNRRVSGCNCFSAANRLCYMS